MTIQQAYYWVIRKWNYVVKCDGSDDTIFDKYPRLREFESECAYCQLFIKQGCDGCPLNIGEKLPTLGSCWNIQHPWRAWYKNKTKETALKVVELIKRTKP